MHDNITGIVHLIAPSLHSWEQAGRPIGAALAAIATLALFTLVATLANFALFPALLMLIAIAQFRRTE